MHEDLRERVRSILETAVSTPGVATDELLPLLYEELKALARARLERERAGSTLQATALVHEAWLRIAADRDAEWSGRGHFFGAAALAMRRILVERARERARDKHGGGFERITLDEGLVQVEGPSTDLLALDEALQALERHDPRKASVVNLRHFGGLSNEEIAAHLSISLATVKSDWTYARAWLHRELERGAREAGS